MNAQPVTGSCEQCGRRYALPIPVPGSGDLKLQRVAEVFGWCVECDQLVGRTCCWGPGPSCAQCAQARSASGDAGSAFAALGATRAAVRHVDGMAAEFSAVEDAVATSGGAEAGAVIDTWEDIWLAAGLLKTRLDDSRHAAASWLRAIPPDEVERVVELEEELDVLATSLDARWRSLTEGIAGAGRRFATLLPKDDQQHVPRGAAGADRAASAPGLAPIPVAAVAVAVPVPVRPPERVTIPIPANVLTPSPAPRTPGITPRPTSEPAVTVSPSSTDSATLGRPSPRPTVRPRSLPARPPPDSSGPGLRVAPIEPRARPEPANTGSAPRGKGLAAMALIVIVATAVIGSVLAAIIGPLGRDPRVGDSPSEVPAADSDTRATPSMRSLAAEASPRQSPSGTSIPSSNVVTVDLHPIGSLDPEELPTTRIIGSPEVAAFPTPFDRSVRLRGEAAGLCIGLASSSREGPSSIAFDIHLGEAGAGGRLVFALPQGGQVTGLRLDLVTLEQLDREAWYRLTVTAVGTAGRLEVTRVGDAGPVLEADLAGDATINPTPADEVCISASLSASEASLFVDNLSVEP